MEYLIQKGVSIPLIGFGSYGLGSDPDTAAEEAQTLRAGIERSGMTLIDTAESYGDGASEAFVGRIIQDYDRDRFLIVDKILPEHAAKGGYLSSCRRSLDRLGVNQIDLYLLHWREGLALQGVVDGMEDLVRRGLIKHWGVSNFDTEDMQELFACRNGANCFCNQILYNLRARGPEYELIPWCQAHGGGKPAGARNIGQRRENAGVADAVLRDPEQGSGRRLQNRKIRQTSRQYEKRLFPHRRSASLRVIPIIPSA